MRAVARPLLALLALAHTTLPVSAQTPDGFDASSLERRIDSIRPTFGPPGTPVHVATEDMPVMTPIRVGFGAPGGFEALLELLTGDEGDFEVDIEVPEWATWDRVHLVLVFNIYFSPIARSVPFHVTDDDGRVHRRGQIESVGGCERLRDIDGVVYALTGPEAPTSSLPGDAMAVVEGRLLDAAGCGADLTIEVDRFGEWR